MYLKFDGTFFPFLSDIFWLVHNFVHTKLRQLFHKFQNLNEQQNNFWITLLLNSISKVNLKNANLINLRIWRSYTNLDMNINGPVRRRSESYLQLARWFIWMRHESFAIKDSFGKHNRTMNLSRREKKYKSRVQ